MGIVHGNIASGDRVAGLVEEFFSLASLHSLTFRVSLGSIILDLSADFVTAHSVLTCNSVCQAGLL